MGLLGMSMNILSSLGNLGSTKIILTSNDLFLSTSYREQGCHCVRKARRGHQIMKTNGRRLKLVEVCSLKFSEDYFQYEIAYGIEVNILFHRSLLSTRCLFRHLTGTGQNLTKHCEQNTCTCNTQRGARMQTICLLKIGFVIHQYRKKIIQWFLNLNF